MCACHARYRTASPNALPGSASFFTQNFVGQVGPTKFLGAAQLLTEAAVSRSVTAAAPILPGGGYGVWHSSRETHATDDPFPIKHNPWQSRSGADSWGRGSPRSICQSVKKSGRQEWDGSPTLPYKHWGKKRKKKMMRFPGAGQPMNIMSSAYEREFVHLCVSLCRGYTDTCHGII